MRVTLGQTIVPLPTAVPLINWCDMWPISLMSACAVPSPAQIKANTGAGPALTPDSVAAAAAAGDASLEAYCQMHPSDCAGYKAAVGCPGIASAFSPTVAALFGCGTGSSNVDITGNCPLGFEWDENAGACHAAPEGTTNWTLVALIALGAALLLLRR